MEFVDTKFDFFWHGPLAGVLYGFLMAIFVGGFHIWRALKSPYSFENNKLSVHQENSMLLDESADEVFESCKEFCGSENLSIKESDQETGILKAKQGPNWKAWGHLINFKIKKTDNGEIEVQISSRPRLYFTLADYGKSLENVGKATEFLEKSFSF